MNNNLTDRIYTIKQVAELLSISEYTVRNAIKDHQLECYRFGAWRNAKTRISQRALDKWLDSTKQKGIAR